MVIKLLGAGFTKLKTGEEISDETTRLTLNITSRVEIITRYGLKKVQATVDIPQ